MTSFASNQTHLQVFQNRENPLPQHPQSVTRAFERVAFPKIEGQLRHEDPVVRKKALGAVQELLSEPLTNASCIESGVPLALVALFGDPDAEIRALAAKALRFVLQYDRGCQPVIDSGSLPALVDLIDDPSEAVRGPAYEALIEAARFETVRRELAAQATTLPRVVGKLLHETSRELVDSALRLLDAALNGARNEAALAQCLDDSDALGCCARLLAPASPVSTRERAALLLARLSNTRLECKKAAVRLGCVETLAALLKHPALAPKLAAATALMSLTTVIEAKDAFYACHGAAEALVRLIALRHEVTRINIITLITNLAEHVGCRAQLQAAVAQLTEVLDGAAGDETLRRFASQALRQLAFETRPFDLLPAPAGLPATEPITGVASEGRYDFGSVEDGL